MNDLARLECVKVNSRLHILERGKEVTEAQVMVLEEELGGRVEEERVRASKGRTFTPLLHDLSPIVTPFHPLHFPYPLWPALHMKFDAAEENFVEV